MQKQVRPTSLTSRQPSAVPFFATLVLFAAVLLMTTQTLRAAPSAELWERWTTHDATSQTRLDHSAWTRFLSRYVTARPDGINVVDYGGVSRADKSALADYIDALAAVRVSELNRKEQFAYWVNLYNALTVIVVLDAYPVESIRDIDISPGLFSNGPWGKKLVSVEGEKVSLDDIEHKILRPIWKDPRIHYAVNCASIGCPNLQLEAFTADNSEAFLNAGAVAYINHPRGAEVVRGKLVVSSIYDWFEDDFGGNDAGVIAHLNQYAKPDLKQALRGVSRVNDDRYDWDLNSSIKVAKAKKKRRSTSSWGSRGS